MKTTHLLSFAAVLLMTAVVSAGEVESGVEVDGRIGPYRCTKVAGAPDDGVKAGATLCYTCKLGARPTVFIFAKEPSEQLASLAKKLDATLADNSDKQLSAVINFSGDVNDAYQEEVEKFGKGLKNVAVATSKDGGKFKVNDDAEVTVMSYAGKKVKFNYATDSELTEDEVTKIVKGTDAILAE